jgi:hypothetical protein
MKGPQEQYTDEMKKNFGYYATWQPGVEIQLGHIGIFKDNAFTHISDLASMGIQFEIEADLSKVNLEYNSKGSITVATKVSGTAPPTGSVLTTADAGIIIEFSKESATLFKANNTVTPMIRDTIKLGDEILKLYLAGKWNKKWVVVTELVKAESATIIISNNSAGKIELKANANVNTANIDVADVKFDFSVQYAKGLETKIIAEDGITPLFKIMGMKTGIFIPPSFTAKGLTALDLVTPFNASEKYKGKVHFANLDPMQSA